MPPHAVAGHLVIVLAPLTALLALIYAWRPTSRSGTRLPLVVLAALDLALAVWAEQAGSTLYEELLASAKDAGHELPPTVLRHAHLGDALTVCSFALLATALVVVWRVLAPGRGRGTGAVVASCVLTAAVVGVWWFTGAALVEALHAVWAQHPLWRP
ncbi:hypothetical protein [Nonomuraea wenchangensis]|uniref:Uncharacterized protein n=1 Tax=Nonomuraea wenchangensis TaxID=568860 RepID=A0A1I0L0U8_9ACTN|nr:hypothetical protein [Nonomuraea wenchangensis]SEU32736.1 hypothetical protein SAMN05421811_11167 [Nonomuraea wenchangensis]